MTSTDGPLDALFEVLNTSIEKQQHTRAIKTADEILAIDPKDEDAYTCKIIANMQLGQYDAALALIAKRASLAEKLVFEKAYCLYRSGKIEEALELARAGEPASPAACLQLQAQLHYRLNRSVDSIQTYDRLFKEHKVESLELKTNVVAAYVTAELSKEVPGIMTAMQVSSKQGFEIGFNRACALLGLGDFASAETELRMALKLGRESLFAEDCSEEEVAEELAPLTVQLGYVLGRLGRQTEAEEMYEQVLSNSATEDVVRAIAHNNNIAESGKVEAGAAHKKHVSNAAKRMEALLDKDKPAPLKLTSELEARLSLSQKQALHLNRALLYLLSGRYDAARDTVAAVARQYGDSTPLVLLRAALLAAEGKSQDADALLAQYCSSAKEPAAAVQPCLMRVQLALESGGNPQRALELLSALQGPEGVVRSGAVLASRLALYQQLGDVVGAESMLDAALGYWQQQQQGPGRTKQTPQQQAAASAALGWCLQGLVGLKLKLGKVAEAVRCYQQLQQSGMQQSSSSAGVIGRLIRALAASDAAGATKMAKELPPISTAQVRAVDVDTLEQHLKSSAFKKKEGKKRDGDEMDVDQQHKKKKQRKHKAQLPKAYNPELPGGGLPPPDPERWLPKWQRSDFKKRKATSAQRKQDVVKGSQGAGKVDENLDRSKAAAPAAAEKPSAKPSLPPRKGKGKK